MYSNNTTNLAQFDVEGDIRSVGLRWENWKRSFSIYLEAADIENPLKKRANLLHQGGPGLQEIFYNIPGANIEQEDGVDVYAVAVSKLDEYFSPRHSKVYERHVFRLMKQEEGEGIGKFLLRLRNQAEKCKFPNIDEHLIDQIVEKGNSIELRKKILSAGDSITLEKLINEATSLETVNRELGGFHESEGSTSREECRVNALNVKYKGKSKQVCSRCGFNNHISSDPKCPALERTCNKCNKLGHFAALCRTQKSKLGAFKRKFAEQSKNKFAKYKKQKSSGVHAIEEDAHSENEVNYVFHIDQDETIICSVGGVNIKMLIDSGSKSNLITDKTWENLKKRKIQVIRQEKQPEKVFMAYGSRKPLTVLGSFVSKICTNNNDETATFYVIKDGTNDLLGKDTAKALGVLKIGLEAVNNNVSTFPKFKNVLIDIPIDENVKPLCQPYRRIPIPLETKVNSKLKELLDADIIEEVVGPSRWVSPLVPVLKGNGEVRICVDMRAANKAIIRENYPLPTMNELLPRFRNSQVFSRLDIKNAFHQLEISRDSRYITTFISNKGLFRYKRLMFGISCAPEIFQKTLERILMKCEGTVNFIDDILIFGSDEKEHNTRLRITLKTLRENNVLLNETKCLYGIKEVQFLGHTLSKNGITPLDSYVGVIKTFRPPKTIDEIQSFLGLINYIGKWIPNLATLTEPFRQILRRKLGKHANIEAYWEDKQQEAFQAIKKSLTQIKYLGYYNPDDRTQVIADASPVALGSVLIQFDNRGQPRIIGYGNKSLTSCEKRYCQTEKEALALIWSVEHFKAYLYGKQEFELVTDHKPLEVIFGPRSKPNIRIERWVLRLQSYNYKIVYKPGKSNIADSLSRLCVTSPPSKSFDEESVSQLIEYSRPIAISLNDIKHHSEVDGEFGKVRKGLTEGDWDPSINVYRIFQSELCFHDGILLRGNKLVIPTKLRRDVLLAAHEGHPGISAMKGRLRTKVWWPKIDSDAEKLVKTCRGCILVSTPTAPNPMKRRELPSKPWVDIAIDYLGPLPSKDFILVVIDYYSRYKEIKITKDTTARKTVDLLREIFSRIGYPSSITADNGKQLTSQELYEFCHQRGITLHHSIPYWPQQNGEVERQNRDILKRIKISQSLKQDWKKELLDYLVMYNSTPHTVTGKTPGELFFGRQFRDKIPSLLDLEHTKDNEVSDRDKIEKEKGKEYSDKKRKAQEDCFQEGDKVYVKEMQRENKISPNYMADPHTIINKKGADVQVRNDENLRRNVVHLKKVDGEWTVLPDEKDRDCERNN